MSEIIHAGTNYINGINELELVLFFRKISLMAKAFYCVEKNDCHPF